jgi:hypothetical protein
MLLTDVVKLAKASKSGHAPEISAHFKNTKLRMQYAIFCLRFRATTSAIRRVARLMCAPAAQLRTVLLITAGGRFGAWATPAKARMTDDVGLWCSPRSA